MCGDGATALGSCFFPRGRLAPALGWKVAAAAVSCEPDLDGRSVLAVACCGWEGFSFGCPCPWDAPWVAAFELWLTRLLLPTAALSLPATVALAVVGAVTACDGWVACFAVTEEARAAAAEVVAEREVLVAGGCTGRGCSCGVGSMAAVAGAAMAVVVGATVLTTTAGVGDAGQPCMGKSARFVRSRAKI